MRPYTLAFSVAVHLLVVALIVITPIVANGVPPEPRRAFDFIVVRPVDPPPSPPSPVQRDRSTMAAATNRGGAPLDAPDGITQETGLDDVATAWTISPVPCRRACPVMAPRGCFRADRPASAAGRREAAWARRRIDPAAAEDSPRRARLPRARTGGAQGGNRHPRSRNRRRRPGAEPARAALRSAAAVDAVRQWQFTPTLLNGEPVPVVMTVTVGFVLNP